MHVDRGILRSLSVCRIDSRSSSHQAVKPFSEIPGPPLLPIITNLYTLPMMIFNIERIIEIYSANFVKYGPIFKLELGSVKMVHVCRAEDAEVVMRHEGKYPRRLVMEPWLNWKEKHHACKGPLLEEGEKWKRLRSQLDKRMLRRDFVSEYLNDFIEVSNDVVAKINNSNSAKQPYYHDIEDTLFHWSLQSSGLVVYETRLGGSSMSKEISELIVAVQNLFVATNHLFYTPIWINKIFFRKWHLMLHESWHTVVNTTAALVGAKLKSLTAEEGSKGGGFLHHMLTTDLSEDEIFGSINEIILGAVETTSTTMLWLLHELTLQPSLQDLLYQEVSLLPHGIPQILDDLDKVPLVKACVKETLRLYPVIAVLPRILDDVVLSNHIVDKGATVFLNLHQMGRSEDYFEAPDHFKPQRWLRRQGGEGAKHKFAWIPFGFGPRSCIGRRIAELELHLLLCMLIHKFKVTSADSSPVTAISKSFSSPSRSLKLIFTPRK